jgi:hypothetical protein
MTDNTYPIDGVTVCPCGNKYWVYLRCADCGELFKTPPAVVADLDRQLNTRYEAWVRQTNSCTFEYGVYVWRDRGICGPAITTTIVHGFDAKEAWDNVKTALRAQGYLLVGDWHVRESYDGITLERDAVLA